MCLVTRCNILENPVLWYINIPFFKNVLFNNWYLTWDKATNPFATGAFIRRSSLTFLWFKICTAKKSRWKVYILHKSCIYIVKDFPTSVLHVYSSETVLTLTWQNLKVLLSSQMNLSYYLKYNSTFK